MAPQRYLFSLIGKQLGQSNAPTASANDSNGSAHAENAPTERNCESDFEKISKTEAWLLTRTALFLRLFFLFLRQARERNHPFAFFQIDETHPLSISADDPDIFDAQTDDLAPIGDQHELIILSHLLRAHYTAGLVGRFHRDDALAA